MTRFRAYTSDSASDGDELSSDNERRAKQARNTGERDKEGDDHFGLTSGDESSSSSSSIASQRKRKTKRIAARRTGSRGATAEGEEGYANEVAVLPPTTPSPPPADSTILPWAQQIGVDAQKMHAMQTSLFRIPEEAATLKALNEPPPSRPAIRKAILNRKHSRDSEGDDMRGEPQEIWLLEYGFQEYLR